MSNERPEGMKYYDQIFDSCSSINSIAYNLETIANSLYVVGNSELGETLSRYVQTLRESEKTIVSSLGAETNRQWNESNKEFDNFIKTIAELPGVTIAKV